MQEIQNRLAATTSAANLEVGTQKKIAFTRKILRAERKLDHHLVVVVGAPFRHSLFGFVLLPFAFVVVSILLSLALKEGVPCQKTY